MTDQWQALGWTLIHFLWQAAAIAFVYRIADLLLTRSSAVVRYAVALAALVAMLGASLVTLAWEEASNRAGTPQASEHALSFMVAGPPLPAKVARNATPPEASQGNAPRFQIDNALPWLDALWLAGVLSLSLRALGGWWFLERVRRAAFERAPHTLMLRLDVLRWELGIRTCIDLRLSEKISNPLTAGVLRPWILLPVAALTNLTPEQLEMVLLHELAHIRRGDFCWNLLQTAIETVFFFHPAVWWISHRVREERELCCDDVAVDCCSDPAVYASALLRLEEERRNQLHLAMALDGRARAGLRARILRILNSPGNSPGSSVDGLREQTRFRPISIAILAAALVVFACPMPRVLASLHSVPKTANSVAAAVNQAATSTQGQTGAHAALQAAKPSAAVPADSAAGSSGASSSEASRSESSSEASAQQTPAPAAKADAPAQNPGQSDYIDAMRAAGYNVDLDKYIAMKVQGITPEYAAAMAKEFGHTVPADQLIAMKVQEVTPVYMAQMHAAGYDVDLSKLIAMKVQSITPQYADEMSKAGFGKPDANQLIALKVQGVTPDYAEKLRAEGIGVSSLDDLIAYRIFAVTPEFIAEMKAAGYGTIPSKKLVALRVQGVTPEYAKSIRAQFPDATVDQLIQLRVFHIDRDFIASATRHGFAPLTIDKLVKLRISGILEGDHADNHTGDHTGEGRP